MPSGPESPLLGLLCFVRCIEEEELQHNTQRVAVGAPRLNLVS